MKATKPYIKAKYDDKIIFTDEKKGKGRKKPTAVSQVWEKSQGIWKNHPVFGTMNIKEAIEWLRGEDCDV